MAGVWMSGIGAAVTLIANFLLIPKLGYAGAAWATLVCYALMMVVSWLWGQRKYPVPYSALKIGLLIGIALLLTMLFEQMKPEPGVGRVLSSIILLLAYLGAGIFILKEEIRVWVKR
jgi:O-antigen/teichoic acid export membrane protein